MKTQTPGQPPMFVLRILSKGDRKVAMSASKVSGNVVSPRLAQGHSTSIIIIISIQLILVISAVHGSTVNKIQLRCVRDKHPFTWTASFDDEKCSNEQGIVVKRVQVFDEDCENKTKANKSIFDVIVQACNGKTECTVSQLRPELCDTHACIGVAFTCSSTADGISTKPTTERRHTGTDGTSRENVATNESMDNDNDSPDMKVVIIVVVSVVAFVAIVIAVTLCLLFFCCQKSPLYRRSTMVGRDRQQYQGEYDYVDESRIQDLISSPEGSTHLRGVLCVSPQQCSTSREYHNTITPEYQHYERISSNESPDPTNRTTPSSSPKLSVTIIPVKSELLKSASSNSGSPQPVDRYNTDQTHPVNAEDGVAGIHGHLTTVDLKEGIYSVARPISPSANAGPATCINALSVTGDYAHLTHPGEDPQAMENVYDG